MLMVHFAPEHALRKICRDGIAPSRYSKCSARACGVYALPLVQEVERTNVRMWRRVLRHTHNGTRPARLASVTFRLPDPEPLYWFEDYTDNWFGPNHVLTTAAHAARRMAELSGLTKFSFEGWLEQQDNPLCAELSQYQKNRTVGQEMRKLMWQRITPESMIESVRNDWLESRNRGWMGFAPEAVIPRRIMPKEILRIEVERRAGK